MIYVGIDVAKDKHDCCILGSDGEVLFSPFTRAVFIIVGNTHKN